jgi:hypothetical protein
MRKSKLQQLELEHKLQNNDVVPRGAPASREKKDEVAALIYPLRACALSHSLTHALTQLFDARHGQELAPCKSKDQSALQEQRLLWSLL